MSETDSPLRVAMIIGSTREGRFAPVVAGWFRRLAEQRTGIELDVLDLVDGVRGDEVTPRLAAAEAYVVVTPEYNHSFPAPLKEAVDAHYTQWQAKPVGFVSYGGIGGGLRAVEQLRLVFAELHAMTVRDSVSFHGAWSCFDEDGAPHDPTVVEGAAKGMLDQLEWWGRALRTAREAVPYGQG
ncbi:NADPH-dependent FMN reductase [Phaeacidiphilus oryzae]|uniref:NADPH-dependent FMN reductase n=1 Tax=Phaeacidiphilus oryzae TaxID=348818 RepID=UPI0005659DE3|nr:NAD(P)H-dependent oxidoreductase [Phaeacidiphilus oryzae]